MIGWLHDLWAQTIDGVSFGFINMLQLRAKAGKHDAREFLAYFDRYRELSLDEYYAIPEKHGWRLDDQRETYVFPSPLTSDCAENNHVHMDWFPGPQGWRSPTMFLLHGVMSVSDVGYRLWARKLNTLGWSAIFFHLPYHYGRKPKGALSGEMALTANLIRTAEGIRQAVVELRLLCRLLSEKGCPHVGLWGTSYGGWIASLLAVLEDHISTVWLLEAILDVDVAIWESPASGTIRRQLAARGITRELVKSQLTKACPSYHQPRVRPDHLLLLAGTFDKIAPPQTIRALHEKWVGSHYAEFRQGHVGYQLMPETLKLAQRLLPDLFPLTSN